MPSSSLPAGEQMLPAADLTGTADGSGSPGTDRQVSTLTGAALGGTAMVFVGGSVAVSSVLVTAPYFTAEAVRYAVACLLLVLFGRLAGRPLLIPRGTEWMWLAGIAVTGLVLFNVALVEGSRHAEPAVLGVAVACVPSVLAVAGPLLDGTRPRAAVVAAALVVTCGAGLVDGLGRTDALGIGYAAVVFCTEVAFTLLAMPVLRRLGPLGVSVHAIWLAAIVFTVIGLVREGPGAVRALSGADWLAVGYLAVAVTAVAFVLWYSSVERLGASRAGLLTGISPVTAAVAGILLGGPVPRPLVWVGTAVVAGGLGLGFGLGKDSAGKDSAGKDRPGKDRPGKDRPGKDRPGKDRPGKDRPGKDRPGKDRPGKDRPGMGNIGKGQRRRGRPRKGRPQKGQLTGAGRRDISKKT